MRSRLTILMIYCLFLAPLLWAQPQSSRSTGEIELELQRLKVLGSALYIAAHPDDENTAVLAWLANERKVRTGYLSLTRGDGGQNLIGSEKGPLLGMIRSRELLAAREIDGPEQFFTRAIDFGYTKSADEALKIWNHEAVLSDVVWVIRRFRPDVMITRFSPEFGGHGHHIASATLAAEAFEAAADPKRFPEQLKEVDTWQPRRLVWNAWSRALERLGADSADIIEADVGGFNAYLGKSYSELAALSRSEHKSQGFGSSARRGPLPSHFLHTLGAKAGSDLFDGIDLSWGRIPGGKQIEGLIERAIEEFETANPSAILPILAAANQLMEEQNDHPLVANRQRELQRLMLDCAGIWVEAISQKIQVASGSTIPLKLKVVNRSLAEVRVTDIVMPLAGKKKQEAPSAMNQLLAYNTPFETDFELSIPENAEFSQPYWLRKKAGPGLYEVDEQELIGTPENITPWRVGFTLNIAGQPIAAETPIFYRWTDPVHGESYRHLEITPALTISTGSDLMLFPDRDERMVRVRLKSIKAEHKGEVRVHMPKGWTANPAKLKYDFVEAGEEAVHDIAIQRGANAEIGSIRFAVDKSTYLREVIHIDYDHIPIQTWFREAGIKIIPLDIETGTEKIGYIMGSGDDIPDMLREIGYQVDLLEDAMLDNGDLSAYDVIIAGIRAYNTRQRLKFQQPRLMEFVKAGGTFIIQYNTSHRLVTKDLGPYPLKLSRDRVTLEDAPVTILAEGHPLLSAPNPITAADFDGWVQERGLYFPNEWNEKYEALIASNDPGEPAREGSLLYTTYGKGVFIYSGISWFRQLPAGVPGAFRIFVNLVSAKQGSTQK